MENTSFFARCLAEEGFALEYAGTNTHMALVDLKKFPVQGETFLDGEIASRLLEIAGIVCNKNVIPGDCDAAHASGLRFGLPWLTQRGVTREQLREIARLVKFTLERVRTFTIWSPSGEKKCRGRVPPGVLRAAAEQTLAIADALPYPPQPPPRAIVCGTGARACDNAGKPFPTAGAQCHGGREPHGAAPARRQGAAGARPDADGSPARGRNSGAGGNARLGRARDRRCHRAGTRTAGRPARRSGGCSCLRRTAPAPCAAGSRTSRTDT